MVFAEDLAIKGCGCKRSCMTVCTRVFGGKGFVEDLGIKGCGRKRSCMTVCTRVSGGKGFCVGFGHQGVRVQTVMHDRLHPCPLRSKFCCTYVAASSIKWDTELTVHSLSMRFVRT